ncbi:MAG: Uncharacterised protein [Prochlorococcus marinus str. MIT 9215]|nr:MAG: Uncharacterised protein [Prochlorococcus marinus str. MIT 9215]
MVIKQLTGHQPNRDKPNREQANKENPIGNSQALRLSELWQRLAITTPARRLDPQCVSSGHVDLRATVERFKLPIGMHKLVRA